MKVAQKRDAVLNEKFYFRRNITTCKCDVPGTSTRQLITAKFCMFTMLCSQCHVHNAIHGNYKNYLLIVMPYSSAVARTSDSLSRRQEFESSCCCFDWIQCYIRYNYIMLYNYIMSYNYIMLYTLVTAFDVLGSGDTPKTCSDTICCSNKQDCFPNMTVNEIINGKVRAFMLHRQCQVKTNIVQALMSRIMVLL